MRLTIERFESDARDIVSGPIVQVSDDVQVHTFGECEYADLSGMDLIRIFSDVEVSDNG